MKILHPLRKLSPMRRLASKLCRKAAQIQTILRLEKYLTNLVLFLMVQPTKADGPSIRWLQSNSAITTYPYMCAFNWNLRTPGHTAFVPANPSSVCRAITSIRAIPSVLKPRRQPKI